LHDDGDCWLVTLWGRVCVGAVDTCATRVEFTGRVHKETVVCAKGTLAEVSET